MEIYRDGWEGLTRCQWDKINNNYPGPVWVTVFGGENIFLAKETLRANGLHPDKIPEVFKNNLGTLGKILNKISKTIPLTFIPTPH